MDRTSLIKGHLEMCVLAILSNGKSYGYEIMKELEKHQLKLKGVGSIYPILSKLKDQRWVTDTRELSDSGKARVYYEITPNGRVFLDNKIQEWQELQQDIRSLLSANVQLYANGEERESGRS
ncbi:PadR family transcriptional regulator [Paenibacillus glucanolyticus]|uniref:PadR family transcriptional regulator n=1 Tax=Paenibacillus glucanolyticus TaxID=59843 RepID=UPI00096EACE8|nr:PadR family transcriptional regulator [Paenibacillus glucanolyticus]OMF80991.1 PadR family transcriptional regulator [Paenibacillus glucanolyticus]